MRFHRLLCAVAALALVALPMTAGIKAMTLSELMDITADTLSVRILETSTHATEIDGERLVYTKLSVAGESMRTGEGVSQDVIFWGSHDVSDDFMLSEMPQLQDIRRGNEIVLFVGAESFEGMPIAHNLAYAYRVETIFGNEVVIGKGEGMAFETNVKLDDARNSVREIHIVLEAAKQAAKANK